MVHITCDAEHLSFYVILTSFNLPEYRSGLNFSREFKNLNRRHLLINLK